MQKISQCLLLFTLVCCSVIASGSIQHPLPSDQAFQFSAAVQNTQTVLVRWQIAPGYYLYRQHIHFRIIKPKNTVLGQPLFPKSNSKTLADGQVHAVYDKQLTISIPLLTLKDHNILLEASYQGCSKEGYCYPPTKKVISLNLSQSNMNFKKPLAIDIPIGSTTDLSKHIHLDQKNSAQKVQQLLTTGSLWAILIGCLGFGILMAFTPCVFPMIPILSAIITGQKSINTGHAFTLSLAYVLGMAITYAMAGVLVGWAGSTIQASLQLPWVILLFSLLLVGIALSLFGFYEIQLPQRWRHKISKASQHSRHGTYLGAFSMGILSSLILSPCVTPGIIGVLSYVGHSGHSMLGGLALFTMAVGMGLPLLLIGFFHGKLLPKVGPWMTHIKNWMGILMLGMAIWMLQRILSHTQTMLLWALLAAGIAAYMDAFSSVQTKWAMLRKSLGLLVFVYSILLVIGAVTSIYNPLKPFQLTQSCTSKQPLLFKEVHTVDDIKHAIASAHQKSQPLLLDFWAAWCIDCKTMDSTLFSNAKIQKALAHFTLLRVNLTQNTAANQKIMRHFQVIAPPTLLFFKQSKEIKNARIIGSISLQSFQTQLEKVRLLSTVKD